MRLKDSDLITVYLREPMNTQDDEGYSIVAGVIHNQLE